MANGHQCQKCFRRQQGVEGVMFWPRMIADEVLCLFRVFKCVKITSAAYRKFLESALLLGLSF